MPSVETHWPDPAPTPPPTFDLLGLTEDEMQHLLALTGEHPWTSASPNSAIYEAVRDALR